MCKVLVGDEIFAKIVNSSALTREKIFGAIKIFGNIKNCIKSNKFAGIFAGIVG